MLLHFQQTTVYYNLEAFFKSLFSGYGEVEDISQSAKQAMSCHMLVTRHSIWIGNWIY
jgi:hypothetical protein